MVAVAIVVAAVIVVAVVVVVAAVVGWPRVRKRREHNSCGCGFYFC